MESAELLALQFLLSLIGYALIGVWLVAPWLEERSPRDALTILVFPHAFRHVGLSLLVPGLVEPTMPEEFARGTAFGDLCVVGLALLTLLALRLRWVWAVPLAWLFNVAGTADLLFNLSRAVRLEVAPHLGAAWYGPAFVVPFMLVAHALLFWMLLRRPRLGA